MYEELRELLERARTIAIVGLSRNPSKDSHKVARYLKSRGYRVIPINPMGDVILGEKAYKSLRDLPKELKRIIDIVNIFRPSRDVAEIVEQAIEMKRLYGKPDVIWMQEGIADFEAAQRAEDEGITVVMDKCIMRVHRALIGR